MEGFINGGLSFLADSGYAFGALFAGLLTDMLNVNWAIGLVALLPLSAGRLAAIRLNETLPSLTKQTQK